MGYWGPLVSERHGSTVMQDNDAVDRLLVTAA